jgi:hypothetical protein
MFSFKNVGLITGISSAADKCCLGSLTAALLLIIADWDH